MPAATLGRILASFAVLAAVATSPAASADTVFNWVEVTPSVSPPPTTYAAAASDSGRARIVLFGGSNPSASYSADTWEWDGTTWTIREPAAAPSARYQHEMAHDAARGQTVVFGGFGPSCAASYSGDTWEWDRELEPAAAGLRPELGPLVHEVNCKAVVAAEQPLEG